MAEHIELNYHEPLILPSKYLRAIKNPKTKVVVDNNSEGDCWNHFLNLHVFYKKYNMKCRLVYLSGNFHVESLYKQWLKETSKPKLFTVKVYNIHFKTFATHFRGNYASPKYKKKNFFCFLNNRQHSHRCQSLVYMNYLNLLDKGKVSFREIDRLSANNFSHRCMETNILPEKVAKHIKDTESKIPLHIDYVEQADRLQYSKPLDLNPKIYNSLVNLTSETFYHEPGLFLTEKIIKPMFAGQILILIGQKNSLQYLKTKGFKTFDSIIDERYDNMNNNKRMFAAMDQLKYLYENYTLEELNNITFKIRRYNFKVAQRVFK